MLAKRIIPCLDVKDGRVVKGVNFVGLRDAGDPVELAKYYNLQGADEIVFLDITATHERRDTVARVVEQTAKEVFVPLTVGGGIRTPEDFQLLLRAGADKISVNSAAVKDKTLISRGGRHRRKRHRRRNVGGGHPRRATIHRAGRCGLGNGGTAAGGRGDPSHQHGRRRHESGI